MWRLVWVIDTHFVHSTGEVLPSKNLVIHASAQDLYVDCHIKFTQHINEAGYRNEYFEEEDLLLFSEHLLYVSKCTNMQKYYH